VRLRRAIKTAIAETNAELSDWREIQLDAGYATLADVPTDELDGERARFPLLQRRVLDDDGHAL
jgi:hypothetical protein